MTGNPEERTAGKKPPATRSADSVGVSTPVGEHELSFYIPNLSVGGAEQVTASIVNGLAARGHDVDVLISHPRGELQSEIHEDVSVIALGETPAPIAGIGAHVFAIARYIRQTEPEIVFPQMLHASVVCLAAGRLVSGRTKIIPTVHCSLARNPARTHKSRLVRTTAPWLYRRADHVVAVSEGVADDIVGSLSVERDRVSVLNNPIRVDEIRQRAAAGADHRWLHDDDRDVVLFVGRLAPQKDLETWLRAVKRVHDQRPATRGIVIGKGPDEEPLRTTASELGLDDVVSFAGYVDNPYGFMGDADVFLLTSRYEGLPTVLIEALACGCPVVATDCPSGPAEILAGGEYGRLARVGDTADLADGVLGTLADPPATAPLHERAGRYAPERILDEYERFVAARVAQ